MKKVVQRMCMGCNTKKDKKELIRIVASKDGNITIDKTGKLSGRGAYICDSIECLEKVIKNKRLEKVLEKNISEEKNEKELNIQMKPIPKKKRGEMSL